MDYWRQLDIFDPQKFKVPVHIIGVGATGSCIAETLANMGVSDITAYDFDKVEEHNIPNTVYSLNHIGKYKVNALFDVVKEKTGTLIKPVVTKVEKEAFLKGIVFLCTDTMHSRKEIWENLIKLKPGVSKMIETRLGAEIGYIYTINNLDPLHIEEYEKTLYSDEEAEEPPCTYRGIYSIIRVIAGLASQKIVKFSRGELVNNKILIKEGGEKENNVEIFCSKPLVFTCSKW